MIEDALYTVMTSNAGLTALIGTRVYAGVLRQDVTYPAIAYRQVGETVNTILESPGTNGQVAIRYRFFSTARTYRQAKQVDAALRNALVGYRGTVSGYEIQGVFLAPLAADEYDDGSETYQFIRDFTVHAVR